MEHASWMGLVLALLVAGCGADEEPSPAGGSGGAAGSGGSGGGEADAGDEGGSGGAVGGETLDPGIVTQGTVETESTLVAAPDGRVALAYMRFGAGNIGYMFSTDDGVSFLPAVTLTEPSGKRLADPVLDVAPDGSIYLVWVGFILNGGNLESMQVYAARAEPGATQFGPLHEVSDPAASLSDKPWLDILDDGTLLVANVELNGGNVVVHRSTGDPAVWEHLAVVPGGAGAMPYLCHAPGGRAYLLYRNNNTKRIMLRMSDDGGATWPGATTLVDPEGIALWEQPTCVASGEELWVSYGVGVDDVSGSASPKLDRVRVAYSSNGGDSIDAMYDAHDPTAGVYFLHPALAREEGGGLHVTYYAGDSDGDTAGSFRWARSTDGAQTFGESVAIREPIVFTTARNTTKFLGDYNGLFWARGNLYVAYTDNTGNAHIGFYRTAAPPP